MKAARLRRLAEVNPETAEFSALPDDADVTFMPLETVWADDRRDLGRTAKKVDVSSGYARFREGDVLCPKVTPTFQAGRSTHVESLPHRVGAATTEVHVIRARPDRADPRFLKYRLLAKDFLEEGAANFQGVAGLQRVSADFVASLPVLPLSIADQQRIGDFLDDQVARIDGLIAARSVQESLVSEWKRSALSALFQAGSPRKLQAFLVQRPCYGVLVPRFVDSSGVPFIRVGDLPGLWNGEHGLPMIEAEQSAEYSRTVVKAGDLLVSVVGSVDKVAVVPPWQAGSNVARAVARLRPPNIDVAWALHAWMQTDLYLDQARLSTGGDTAQPTLNMGDLSQFTLRLEGAATVAKEAREVAEESARQSRLLGLSIELLNEYKRSLITAAVMGELDVTTARQGVPA